MKKEKQNPDKIVCSEFFYPNYFLSYDSFFSRLYKGKQRRVRGQRTCITKLNVFNYYNYTGVPCKPQNYMLPGTKDHPYHAAVARTTINPNNVPVLSFSEVGFPVFYIVRSQ